MERQLFSTFLAAVRSGDGRAVADFVRRYEPYLRQVARRRLTDERVRRVHDSDDVCQSALAAFFAGAAAGNFNLSTSVKLRAVLAGLANNKAIDRVRKERHHGGGLPDGHDPAGSSPTPSQQLLRQDLLDVMKSRLSERERQIFNLRSLGLTYPRIAARVGGTAEAVRMVHDRLIRRLREEFGEEGSGDVR